MNLKPLYIIFSCFSLLYLCNACKSNAPTTEVSDTEKALFQEKENAEVRIANDSIAYEIIIIEPGFNTWVQSIAKPKGYHSQSYLENRNQIYVAEWNNRVLAPGRYNSNLYEMRIDYQSFTDYGYEVNYLLYNYFIYFFRIA